MRFLRWGLFGALALFLLIQLIPYGRSHTNPPVTGEPNWDSRRTRQLAETACFSCHSNETEYPWYSNVAPASWLIQRDIDEGRDALNFSEFDRDQGADEAAEVVAEGEMPQTRYTLINPRRAPERHGAATARPRPRGNVWGPRRRRGRLRR